MLPPVVADAAKYCGVVKTTQPIAIGDVAASVTSIFTQLVPSAQTETPLLDLTAGGTSEALVDSANGTVSYTTSVGFSAATILSVGNAIQPGTLSISVSGATLTDNGGQLMAGATVIGTVNYARGQVAMAREVFEELGIDLGLIVGGGVLRGFCTRRAGSPADTPR